MKARKESTPPNIILLCNRARAHTQTHLLCSFKCYRRADLLLQTSILSSTKSERNGNNCSRRKHCKQLHEYQKREDRKTGESSRRLPAAAGARRRRFKTLVAPSPSSPSPAPRSRRASTAGSLFPVLSSRFSFPGSQFPVPGGGALCQNNPGRQVFLFRSTSFFPFDTSPAAMPTAGSGNLGSG